MREEEEGKPSESMPSETFCKFLINAFSCMLYIKNKMKKEKPHLATLIVDGIYNVSEINHFCCRKEKTRMSSSSYLSIARPP